MLDGNPVAGWFPQTQLWDSTSVENGVHTLTLTGEEVSASLLVSNDGESVTAHEGTLAEDEEWSSETAHHWIFTENELLIRVKSFVPHNLWSKCYCF